MTIEQALDLYGTHHAPTVAAPQRIGYAMAALLPFWGHMKVADIKGATCRRYAKERGVSDGTIRRELGTLQAALKFCQKEGYLLSAPEVSRPSPPPARERYLTRQEAAWLLRASRRLRIDGRHLSRFILASLYTGTRKAAVLSLRIDTPSTRGGWIDTERGVIYRQPEGKRQTKKRQTPARLPRGFLAHVRRWKARGAQFVVQDHEGQQVGDIKKGWARCVRLAETLAAEKGAALDLTGVVPHTLRHTTATWLMQSGADLWDAAGLLGMSVETLQRGYGHHHPDHQESAVAALERGRKG